MARPANGTLTRTDRPPLGDEAKQQVTLRLDPDVLAKFCEGEPGWHGQINTALRMAARISTRLVKGPLAIEYAATPIFSLFRR